MIVSDILTYVHLLVYDIHAELFRGNLQFALQFTLTCIKTLEWFDNAQMDGQMFRWTDAMKYIKKKKVYQMLMGEFGE